MYEKLNQTQLFQVGQVYSAISLCTPTEGRDFTVEIDFPDGGIQPTVKITGISDMGRAWVPHCYAALNAAFGATATPIQNQDEIKET